MARNSNWMYPLIGAVCAASPAAETLAQSEGGVALEEVIVTASRREQSLQDVPAAVSVVSPDNFKFQGLKQVSNILDYTPGVTFNDLGGVGQGSISARGVPQALATPVFGIYVDDTPVSTNTNFSAGGNFFFDGLMMDIERVEVIKGPQGTLYGATSVGGMIRYITRQPALQEVRASVSAETADTRSGEDGQTYSGRISLPIVPDRLGLTLSGFRQETGGYVDYVDGATGAVLEEDVDGGVNKGYAADLLFAVTDDFELRLKYLKQEVESEAESRVRLAGPGSDDGRWSDYSSDTMPGDRLLEYEITSGTLNYNTAWGTLTANSSYVDYGYRFLDDFTSQYAPLVDLFAGREPGTTSSVIADLGAGSEKFVQELRFTSTRMGAFEWIAGLYYADEESFNSQVLRATPPFDVLTASFPAEYEEYAAFGDITWYLSDNFDLTAGVRVSESEIFLTYETSGVLIGPANLVTEPVEDTVDTYLFAARYHPVDNLSLYGRVASGYRPAQSNIPIIDPSTGENIAPPVVDSDNIWSYELGAKGYLANGGLKYDVALWYIDWANFQAGVVSNGVRTGGNARGGLSAHGLEGELTYELMDNLSLIANMAYTDSTLDEDEPGFGGVGGEQFPGLPEWTASLRWDYRFPVAGDWDGQLGGGVRYADGFVSTYGASASQVPVDVDSRLVTDLNANVTDGRYTVGVFVTNLFDERTLTSRDDDIIAGTGVVSSGVFERPRTLGLNVRVDL